MPNSKEQEFRIHAWRPAGDMKRNPDAQFQDESVTLVYAKGKGDTMKKRMAAAMKRAKQLLSLYRFDRYLISLTIADEENALHVSKKS